MPKLPEYDPVWIAIEQGEIPNLCRPHLGMSQLGHECRRYLWYSFRWAYLEYITPRQQRIFDRGHMEEPRIEADLRRVGVTITNQQAEIVGFAGHCLGHIDGEGENIPGAEKTKHLLEYKGLKDKKFVEMERFGVERANPVYYAQAQCYMKGRGLTRTLFVATNKDTEARHYERLHYDKAKAEELMSVAMDVIGTDIPPAKLSERVDYYQCKWCAAQDICHRGKPMLKGCRTCAKVEIHDNGEWKCGDHPEWGPIPVDFQRKGCDQYRPLC